MKQTTILPFYKPITPKKSPLPSFKSNTKSPYSKSSPPGNAFQQTFTLSPMTKRTLIPIDENQEKITTPLKPVNRSNKRRTRDSFEGLSQSYQKKFKNNSEFQEEEEEKVLVKLGPKNDSLKESLIQGHENAFNKQNTENPTIETADKSFISSFLNSKDQEEAKTPNEYISNVSTSSPNSYLEKEIIGLPEEVRASQVLKHLSSRKLTVEKEDSSKNTSPVKEDKPKNTQTPKLSESTLSILNSIKAKNAQKSYEAPEVSNTKMIEELPEEEPKLSKDTLSLIKLLKAKSTPPKYPEQIEKTPVKTMKTLNEQLTQPKPRNSVIETVNGPSIREKYAELIAQEREFVLPVFYKRLMAVFDSLDKAMNYFLMRREPTFFTALERSVEDMLKIRVAHAQLAQIAYVLPSAYTMSWKKNDKYRGELDLYLEFPNNENGTETTAKKTLSIQQLDERRLLFKEALVKITKAHHNEFLKTLNEIEREKNYDELRCWNSKFKVHECPAIPEGKLPERPHRENLKSVKDFLSLTENKNSRVMKIMEECVKENEDKEKAAMQTAEPVARQYKNISGISEKLLAKVRAKEQAIAKEASERLQKQTTEKYSIMQQELKKVAETLRVYYTHRSVSSMFFANVVEHIVKNSHGLVLGSNEASKYIEELIKLCPGWLSVHDINTNRILKIDKTVNMQVIYEKIEKGTLA